jgi:hypothetical protein
MRALVVFRVQIFIGLLSRPVIRTGNDVGSSAFRVKLLLSFRLVPSLRFSSSLA